MMGTPTFKVLFVASLLLAACSPTEAGDDVSSGADVSQDLTHLNDGEQLPLPEFVARINASPVSGNSPLAVSFSVDLQGDVQPYEVGYTWLIADTISYGDAAFSHTFFQKGNHSIYLKVTYKAPDGRIQFSEDHLTITVAGCADLAWDQLSLAPPVEVAEGDMVTLKQGTLFNNGDRIDNAFVVAVYLSATDAFDIETSERVAEWEFDGMDSGIFGQSVVDFAGKSFELPAGVADGLYYVFIQADDAQSVNECQEDNNIAVMTNNLNVDASVALKADLTITNVAFPEGLEVDLGENVNYQFRVENNGIGEAGKFGLGFWLSVDKTLDPEQDLLMFGPEDLGATMQQMLPGGGQNFFKSFKIPEVLADGKYWMIGMADVNQQVVEESEGNNVAVSDFQITVEHKVKQCVDMALDSFELSPLASYWKGTVEASMTISNPGTVVTPDGWKIKAYISLQASLNPAIATVVGNWSLPAIGPGQEIVISKIITIPNGIPVQPHYIGVILDPDLDVTECSEGNNSAMYPEPVKITSQATMDVATNNVQFHPSTVQAGETIKVSYTLANSGTSNATAFETVVVLSKDPVVSYADINNETDLVIHTSVVASVPATASITQVQDVVVPIALPHDVSTYYLAVVADPNKDLQLDNKKNNNISLAAGVLTVTDAMGGCFEDSHEANNTFGSAVTLEAGVVGDLGSCGDEDWYKISVPAEHSLVVTATVSAILGLDPVPADLDVELIGTDLAILDASNNAGDAESVHTFNVPEEGYYYLRVFPKGGSASAIMASYELDIAVLPPVDGIDFLSVDVGASPKNIYPGGLLNVSWSVVNIGKEGGGEHAATIWASKDATLDPAEDTLLAEVEGDAVAPKTTSNRSHTFLLPPDMAGGNWRFLVRVDSGDVITEASEENNVGASDVVFLDPLLTCDDDELEPNNEISQASTLTLNDGLALVSGAVVCPSLDDWFAVSVEEGQVLNVSVKYDHDNNKGLLGVELWDVSQSLLLFKDESKDNAAVNVPWVWSSGVYYVRVHSVPAQGKVGPYEYDLTVTAGPADSSDQCDGDVFEDNNSIAGAKFIGCGLQAATLCKGDVDVYRIELEQGNSLQVTLEHPQASLKMSLFESGSVVPSVTKSGNKTLAYPSGLAQTVYLQVESKGDPASLESFDYTLFLDGVNGVDLTVSEPTLFMTEVYQGDDALIDFQIVNSCVDVAGAFEASVWLSTDTELGEGDVFLKTIFVEGLEAKGSAPFSEKVVVPFSTQPGTYYLIAEADTGGVIEESNEGNNSNATGLSVAKLCVPDGFEPNDVLTADAPFAPALETGDPNELALCPYELDWFSIQAEGGTVIDVLASFSHGEGDLDMRLYDPNYSTTIPVAVSATKDDDESIAYEVPVSGTFLIRIHGFNGSSASYALDVSEQ